MKPRISVIVPTFNSALSLRQALQSLLDQTLDQRLMEIVIVDDCSTDATWEILTQFAGKHSHTRAFQLEQFSRGPGMGRNAGVAHAEGEWIAFLDADDEYCPDGLETLLSLAEEEPCDIAWARLEYVENGIGVSPQVYDDVVTNDLVATTVVEHPEVLWPPLSVCGRLFRADYLAENQIKSPEEVIAQDSVFTTEAMLRAAAISCSAKVVYRYHRKPDGEVLSISDNLNSQYFLDWIKTRTMIEELYERYALRPYWETRYNTDLRHGMVQLLRFSRRLELDDEGQLAALVDVVTRLGEFCSHYRSADLRNIHQFRSLLPMLIGDGNVDEAVEIIRLWNAAQRSTIGPPGSGG